MRIGIVGAGLNSDYHIIFSKAYDGAKIVGIADSDLPRAQECAKKHGILGVYGSVTALLQEAKPDVVHVVTPPRTHYDVVREVLEAKCHVLVEKPLALNWEEAKDLYDIAERQGVKLCPVHNHLFDPCMRKADDLIKQGALGKVINVESYYGLNTIIPAFRDYPRPNVVPWLYALPGGVYQDFLPHALYVLLEYTGAPREIKVMQRTTGVLPQNLPDEIRILVDGEEAFGIITFSFAAKPHLHFIRVYGTKMMTDIDINTMTTVVHPLSSLPKAAQKVIYNLQEGWQQTRSTLSNVYRFLTGKLKPYHGMMILIHLYYDSIRSGNPPPVSKEKALLVVKTMDEIFKQLKFDPLKHERIVPEGVTMRKHPERILVTGGTGFVGRRLVERLIGEGYAVRVLARKLANVDKLNGLGAEIFWGDVADLESFEQAFIGNDIIVHLAAGTSGSEKDCEAGTIQGTKNVLELCRRHKPRKLIYISSCSVYGVADFRKNQLVPESASLERFPEKRGNYSASKQEAETNVTEFMKSGDVPAVILRPGTIYGPGGDIYTPMMGFSMGKLYVIIGNGKFLLPFVYIDNLVDAIIGSIEAKEGDNQVFNVVDTDRVSKREYMNNVIRKIHPDAKVLYFPYLILYGIIWFQEIALGLLKRRPFLTRYRLDSSQKSIVYDNRKIVETLGWHPRIDASEAFDRLVAFEKSKSRPSQL